MYYFCYLELFNLIWSDIWQPFLSIFVTLVVTYCNLHYTAGFCKRLLKHCHFYHDCKSSLVFMYQRQNWMCLIWSSLVYGSLSLFYLGCLLYTAAGTTVHIFRSPIYRPLKTLPFSPRQQVKPCIYVSKAKLSHHMGQSVILLSQEGRIGAVHGYGSVIRIRIATKYYILWEVGLNKYLSIGATKEF